jgi:NTP pyrophosphatase (non-canonical NTP hydrolase)
MNLQEYADWMRNRWDNHPKHSDERDLTIAGLGVGGEAGEVQEHIKKFIRDRKWPDLNELRLELGDVIHYAVRIGQLFNIEFQEIINANVDKLNARDAAAKRSDP